MAANFWTSSHSKKLLDVEDIAKVLPADRELGLTVEDTKILKNHCALNIKVLAQQAKVRQRVVATAIAYFRRIYVKKAYSEYDPRLVAPCCLYLAAKAEECTVQAKVLVFYMKKLWPAVGFEIKDILEMEMKLLEALDCHLLIFHPYRPMVLYLKEAGLTQDLVQMCWSILNDSYRTDLCLMFPPHMIALSCIYLSCVLKERDIRLWFEELRIDMNMVRSITMELMDFYENYQTISNEKINMALAKILSPRIPRPDTIQSLQNHMYKGRP